MTTENVHSLLDESFTHYFIGRTEALEAFYQCASHHQKASGLYFYGPGGVGKTWLLQKIWLDSKDNPRRFVAGIIDFYVTDNLIKTGLQCSIKEQLEPVATNSIFQSYDKALDELKRIQDTAIGGEQPRLTVLEKEADSIFLDCCNRIAQDRTIVLLFDTFNLVQQSAVGQWLLAEFIPRLKNYIVVIAARSEPSVQGLPDDIKPYQLAGLSPDDINDLLNKKLPLPASKTLVDQVLQFTEGTPILVTLLMDFIGSISQQDMDKIINKKTPERYVEFYRQATTLSMSGHSNPRIDKSLLKHLTGQEYDEALAKLLVELENYPQIIKHSEHEAPLLHDEFRNLLNRYVWPQKSKSD